MVKVNPSTQGAGFRAVMEPDIPLEMLREGNMMGCGEWVERSRFWHPGIWPRPLPLIAMINLYCDESHDNTTYALAGWIADSSSWDWLDPVWKAMLKQHNAPAFHAAEIVGRDTITDSRFKGWTFEQEVALFSHATDILTESEKLPDLCSIGCSVAVPDKSNIESQDVLWFLLFGRLLAMLVEFDRGGISLMFDEKPELRGIVDRFYYQAKELIDKAHPGKLANCALSFRSDETTMPLQAADFFAYEWRKRISDRVKEPHKKIRKSYARLR